MQKTTDVQWEPIKDYLGYYEISNRGIVRSVQRKVKIKDKYRTYNQKILKIRINNCGYVEVRLSKDNLTKCKFIHVLLAEAFIPNPDNKKEVNHKNGIKTDNRLENLEWVTHAENVQHAYNSGLIIKMTRPVIDTCTGEEFASARIASEFYGIPYSTCRNYLNGRRKNPTCLLYMDVVEMAA